MRGFCVRRGCRSCHAVSIVSRTSSTVGALTGRRIFPCVDPGMFRARRILAAESLCREQGMREHCGGLINVLGVKIPLFHCNETPSSGGGLVGTQITAFVAPGVLLPPPRSSGRANVLRAGHV